MNDVIKSAIEKGELILFLGAGASKGGKTSAGTDILDGDSLAEKLANQASIPYSGEPLDEVYAAVRAQLESRLDPILEQLLRHVRPSVEVRHARRICLAADLYAEYRRRDRTGISQFGAKPLRQTFCGCD